MALTETQKAILAVLDIMSNKDSHLTPQQVAEAVNRQSQTNLSSGSAARSLRKLMELGLVEQKQIGWFKKKAGIGLFAYRKALA
jgi:predicted transcriptional regulator